MSCCVKIKRIGVLALLLTLNAWAEEGGERWGTEKREREFYRVVNVPIPKTMVVEAGAFELMPDKRLAIGTRRGDIFLLSGIDVIEGNSNGRTIRLRWFIAQTLAAGFLPQCEGSGDSVMKDLHFRTRLERFTIAEVAVLG